MKSIGYLRFDSVPMYYAFSKVERLLQKHFQSCNAYVRDSFDLRTLYFSVEIYDCLGQSALQVDAPKLSRRNSKRKTKQTTVRRPSVNRQRADDPGWAMDQVAQ
ncbi:hypothetical protein OUZ56_026511 [Daphnia magna]|uniref:Uncharacterized protein n=1 Tax=Daphnia magna TaxID=35525 RepID=A0ABQ9ZM01_9CRUS|nr:hypothetical protein OUZ56_026511 [Daphnia magna]